MVESSGVGVARSRALVVLLLGSLAASLPEPAGAIDLKRRLTLGVRVGDYLAVDEQKGGFRFFGSLTGAAGQNDVALSEVPAPSVSVGFGVKEWKKFQMSLELGVSRIATSVGDETAYVDRNASSRIVVPPAGGTEQDGDEAFEQYELGEVNLTPVFLNVLLHRSGENDPERADFYFGGGLGLVFADLEEADDYRDFAGDFEGSDDVQVDDSFGVMVKFGSNVRLSKKGRWFLYFEAEFFSTGLVTSQPQIRWTGVDYFAGQQEVDTNGDGVDDTTIPADYRLMDPGKVRVDGAIAGIGLRYRFGKRSRAVEERAPSDGELSDEVAPTEEGSPDPAEPPTESDEQPL